MDPADVEHVRRAFAAWSEEGVDALPRFWREDGVWVDEPGLPDAATHEGLDAVTAHLGDFLSVLPQVSLEVDEMRPAGEELLVLGRFAARGSSGRVPFEQPIGVLVAVAGGRIARMRVFLSHDAAVAAAAGPG